MCGIAVPADSASYSLRNDSRLLFRLGLGLSWLDPVPISRSQAQAKPSGITPTMAEFFFEFNDLLRGGTGAKMLFFLELSGEPGVCKVFPVLDFSRPHADCLSFTLLVFPTTPGAAPDVPTPLPCPQAAAFTSAFLALSMSHSISSAAIDAMLWFW